MSKYMIRLDKERCISCKACEVHCKNKNKVPKGAKLNQLISIGPTGKGAKPKIQPMYLTCFHCEKAYCIAACPSDAIVRREEDGIVYIDADLCVGCKACISACPWNIPQWDDALGKAIKCDYCRDRVDKGLDPACVTACCTKALEFVRPNKATQRDRVKYAEKVLMRKS